ncbi:hypothetical protein MKW92_044309 [Papaver armeniacum]|nr:hypothetical protein MKW92_044309 [Papaver armeniacum]
MGCVASKKIEDEERLQRCKERRKLMKQLLILRADFASSQMSYLQSLKNTGITLRQFAEAESCELDIVSNSFRQEQQPLQPPPPPPPRLQQRKSLLGSLPPPPPPPPQYSPDRRGGGEEEEEDEESDDESEISTDDKGMKKKRSVEILPPPPPPMSGSNWEFWDPFVVVPISKNEQKVEEEDWEETKTEFEDGEEEDDDDGGEEEEERDEHEVVVNDVLNSLREKTLMVELNDDNSSTASWNTKQDAGSENMAMLVGESTRRRNFNSLLGIVKEIDDYFLRAYESGRGVAVLLEVNRGDSIHQDFEASQRKSFKSAKVFSALSWSWSSKSLQSSRDAIESHDPNEPCKPGAHCITLEKINAEEEKLYKEIKEEEITKLEYERKTSLLQRQETGDYDLLRTEEARANIESLESNLSYLQHSIGKTCLTLLKLRDEELHPQLLELSSRLMRMWRTMYECHQVQNNISQQVNRLREYPSTEPTTAFHCLSTTQLEREVNIWYNSFCNLVKSQREYIRVLNRWVQLAESLAEDQPQIGLTSNIHILCEEWQLAFDRLPEKVAAEAIKSFVSVIHSIVLQQNEERNLQKKSDQLEKRLEKELNTLYEMEKKSKSNSTTDADPSLSPGHPLVVKRARIEAFRKKVDDEKAKYLHSVQVSRAMTLNNLQTSLPNVFQALTGFASVCIQTFEAIHKPTQSVVTTHDVNLVT